MQSRHYDKTFCTIYSSVLRSLSTLQPANISPDSQRLVNTTFLDPALQKVVLGLGFSVVGGRGCDKNLLTSQGVTQKFQFLALNQDC